MNDPVVACGVLLIDDGAILGISRKDDPCAFGLPAGGRDHHEDMAETAARETHEESGVVLNPKSLVLLLDDIEPRSKKRVVTFWAPFPKDSVVASKEEGNIVWVGWKTLIGPSAPFPEYNTKVREAYIDKIPEGWIQEYGSGSLRRAMQEGMRWREMYYDERTAFEFGHRFSPVLKSRLMIGEPFAEGDSSATTETCWWARRLRKLLPTCQVRVVQAHQTQEDESIHEGIAIQIVPQVNPHWLPAGRSIIAFTTDKDGNTVNPC